MCCLLRRVDNDWRVSGIAYGTAPDQPWTLTDFETGQNTPIPRQTMSATSAGTAPQNGVPDVRRRRGRPKSRRYPSAASLASCQASIQIRTYSRLRQSVRLQTPSSQNLFHFCLVYLSRTCAEHSLYQAAQNGALSDVLGKLA